MRTRRFFFYGTLQGGARTRMARWLEPRLGACARASLAGRLVAIPAGDGWFPALIPGRPGQRAWGTLCDVRLTVRDLARLDRYEGRDYRRATLPVLAQGGGRARAQAYVWRGALPARARPIASGDFLAWLAATGRRPFSTRRNGI
ncbi:gamma-glutamylcyclotransferase [Novosphingobium sp. H3SJ31-1]|uniref:Gamma-glutamylcyclotransferase n=1 Tax=Novosphingobium album (ex Liu et al. 2023) TaxID=3031130 RepID=A0ABT5WLC4_9SPHN|nr:gamma-glutamylcyclotransferase [Novosphingobium album (ex Liu et al. 2023)]